MLGDLLSGSFTAVAPEVAFMRLVLSLILGAAIGFERALHASTAGLRTHILIAMASCLFALLSMEIMARESDEPSDPLRLIEAVTAGVAFLAAGSIIMARGAVLGLTTGAGMWLAGAIGLACGIGAAGLGIMATVLVIPVLWVLRPVSHKLSPDSAPAKDPD